MIRVVASLALLVFSAPVASYTVGIVGGGVVGGGIVTIVEKRAEALAAAELAIKKVAVRSLDKSRDWDAPEGCSLTTDVSEIVGNPDIDLVVEVAGGVTEAKDVVFGALKVGHVTHMGHTLRQDLVSSSSRDSCVLLWAIGLLSCRLDRMW